MLSIRTAKSTDLDSIILCHQKAFPDFFLTLLGTKFLRCFYNEFINDDQAQILVIEVNSEVAGFAAFSMRPKIFFRKIKKSKGFQLFFYALPALMKRPLLVAKKLIRGVVYRGDQASGLDDSALLSSIAVNPTYSGRKLGSELLLAVEESLNKERIKSIYLTTDLIENDATRGFYRKNGYIEHSQFEQTDGREMLRLIKFL